MEIQNMFSSDLILSHIQSDSLEKLFELVGTILENKGYVNKQYINSLKNREKKYPTGLITQHLNIALPHSETKYVEQPFVYVVRLDEPVEIKQMGDNQVIKVKDLFFLGIKQPDKQVILLSKLIQLFMDEEFVVAYTNASTQDAIYNVIMHYLKKER